MITTEDVLSDIDKEIVRTAQSGFIPRKLFLGQSEQAILSQHALQQNAITLKEVEEGYWTAKRRKFREMAVYLVDDYSFIHVAP